MQMICICKYYLCPRFIQIRTIQRLNTPLRTHRHKNRGVHKMTTGFQPPHPSSGFQYTHLFKSKSFFVSSSFHSYNVLKFLNNPPLRRLTIYSPSSESGTITLSAPLLSNNFASAGELADRITFAFPPHLCIDFKIAKLSSVSLTVEITNLALESPTFSPTSSSEISPNTTLTPAFFNFS